MKKLHCYFFTDDELHAEYAWAWVLHNLVPFVDKVLGIAGAMDQRPIAALDWQIRLPLSLAVAANPTSKPLLAAAHAANVAFWFARMPAVWDYMCWVALTELVYVVAVLRGGGRDFMRTAFLPAARALLITLYFSAAFWKLTTSFLEPKTSCATTLVAELAAALFGDAIATTGAFAKGLMASAPAQIVGIEALVPLLMLRGSRWAVPVAALFHFTINLMPVTYAGGFSISMGCRLVLFLPGALLGTARGERGAAGGVAVLAAMAALFLKAHRGAVDTAGALFVVLGGCYYRRALFDGAPVERLVCRDGPLRRGAVGAGVVYGFLFPVVGVMAMASSSMYGNLRQFDGGYGNHLLAPTGVLQRLYEEADPRTALGGAFGGGVVRLERRGTTGGVFDELFFNADVSHEQPPYAVTLLRDAVPGHPARYFEFYAARNYFERGNSDHADTALHNEKGAGLAPAAQAATPPPALAMPAYELRRALALAKARGEPFKVAYAKLSSATPAAWRVEKPPKADVVAYAWPADACRDGRGRACGPDELPRLPAPPAWLTRFLHPYPVPLLDDGSGDEVHCTT